MVAGNVYQVATKRLELHRRKSLHVRRFIDWHHCRIKSSHCCKCARIRRCIQENVVTWVDQHLKHLKWGGKLTEDRKQVGGINVFSDTLQRPSWLPEVTHMSICPFSGVRLAVGGLWRFFCRFFIHVSSSGILHGAQTHFLSSSSSLKKNLWFEAYNCTKFAFSSSYSIPTQVSYPLEAEYCRALFIVTSLKVTFPPFFSSMVADRKGNVLGLGAPPAKEMRDGGERCCSSAKRGGTQSRQNTKMNYICREL